MATAVEQTSEEDVFNPFWLADLGQLQGFQIRHLDVKSNHMQNLKESIKTRGWSKDEPVIVCKSKDPKANGYIADGRHRLIVCEWIRKETGELPTIPIVFEQVKDFAHAKLRQIYYESAHLLKKSSDNAKEHIIQLWSEVQTLDPKISEGVMLDQYFEKEGKFNDKTRTLAVIAQIQRHEEKERKKMLQEQAYKNETKVKPDASWKIAKPQQKSMEEMSKMPFKRYTADLEMTCAHGKKTNVAVTVKLFENGTVSLEQET